MYFGITALLSCLTNFNLYSNPIKTAQRHPPKFVAERFLKIGYFLSFYCLGHFFRLTTRNTPHGDFLNIQRK